MAVPAGWDSDAGSSAGGAMTIETYTPSRSGNIGPCEYDTETNQLTIEFQHGGTYVYDRVPRGVWDSLKAAASAGSYWNTVKGGFSFRKA